MPQFTLNLRLLRFGFVSKDQSFDRVAAYEGSFVEEEIGVKDADSTQYLSVASVSFFEAAVATPGTLTYTPAWVDFTSGTTYAGCCSFVLFATTPVLEFLFASATRTQLNLVVDVRATYQELVRFGDFEDGEYYWTPSPEPLCCSIVGVSLASEG
jgi:hypothetical protein